MRLIYAIFIVLLALMTSAQCQQTAEDWYTKGIALLEEGKYDEAIQAFDEAIRLDPKHVIAWYNKGVALTRSFQYNEAIQAFDEAIKLHPSDSNALGQKGSALQALGKSKEADSFYDNARNIGKLLSNYLNFLYLNSANSRKLILESNGFVGILFLLLLFIMILISTILNNKSSRLGKGKASSFRSVSEALEVFQAVRSNVLLLILKYLPWILLGASIWIILVDVIFGSDTQLLERINNNDREMVSQLLAYALGLLAVRQLMQLIPITLHTLWTRNIIAIKPKSGFNDEKLIGEEIASTHSQLKSIPLEEQYLTYIHEFEDLLNHPILQWISGILFVLLFASPFFEATLRNPVEILSLSLSALQLNIYNLYLAGFELIAKNIALLLICLITGIMIWRMVITAWQIRRLGKRFDLAPQLGHPDGCGGLSPVGNLCLWIALIISVIGAVIGAWIILWPFLGYPEGSAPYRNLLPVPIALALGSFFLPLWNIHRVMVGKRTAVYQQLDQLGKSINRLEREILGKGDELEPDEAEKTTKKLELLRQTYQRNLQYRTWPYNTEILKKLFLSQTVPVLSLLSQVLPQIGKTSVEATKIIVDSISQWWH